MSGNGPKGNGPKAKGPKGKGNGSKKGANAVDVVVAGAGIAGLYMLHRLRGEGFSAKAIETGADVGGTWYWNRYPGARCDVQSVDYSYTFDRGLDDEWKWSQKYAPQPEILRYLQYVADKHDLRRDIEFSTNVESAKWDENAKRWHIRTSGGEDITCRYYVMATGCLSMPKEVDIEGMDRFKGEVYFTSRWPHEGVDFTGKRVAVIGTGSSGIQSIPIIATQASQLTVFQRTANFSIPARNGPPRADKVSALARGRDEYRAAARLSPFGVPAEPSQVSALAVSDEERNKQYEAVWQNGDIIETLICYSDHLANVDANEKLAEFVRGKIRFIVKDPKTAEVLCPQGYPIGTKRLCVDTNYYETFNLPHVRLVDLRETPIKTITETGIDLADESLTFDAIVFATGFDAMTGALVGVDITGRDGETLKKAWAHGPVTYLGVMTAGFPNLFMITGPGSPSVLSNMVVSIEQHVDWITDTLVHLRAEDIEALEPTPGAVAGWVQHVNDFGDITLFPQANSWYMGANVPGKPRVFLPYVGGADRYRRICDEVVESDYLGFEQRGRKGTRCNDGVVQRVKPDVTVMLELMAGLGLPPMETLSPAEARAFLNTINETRPPGPAVGEIVDGTLPGAAGDLVYRLYRPASASPHPIVVYFHGGGWVLGSADSDEPFCRDLCVRSDSIIVSVDYRHAPEARFPAAIDDAFAAVKWIAAHAEESGGVPGQLAVAGWSAGANLAAVVCQLARDAGGPTIVGQLLVTPVTDSDFATSSYRDNADGYVLTAPLMKWFWDHYADPKDRKDPKASPLRAKNLGGLPPALVVTAEFDPLRAEGKAYADAMRKAGVAVRHLDCPGQIHTSLTMVDLLPTGASARAEMGTALRSFFGAPVPA